MDMSVGRIVDAGTGRRARVQGAVIAGSVAGICLIAVPPGLLELLFASLGLSEVVPVLAPPLGWSLRVALALLAAALAAVIAAGTGRESGSAGIERPDRKRNENMGWTHSLGLHRLVRLARGGATVEDMGGIDHRAVITPAMRAPRSRRSPQEKVQEALTRHRADLHPDAPPRAPLMASRDLPVVPELTVVERPTDTTPLPEARLPIATPIRDTTDQVRARPLPRSPEPFSDSDLGWIKGLLEPEDGQVASGREELAMRPPLPSVMPAPAPARTGGEGVLEADSLMGMLGRFEEGVGQRIALRDAADAQSRIEDSLAVPVAPADAVAVSPVVAAPAGEMDMDAALTAALETLKALSAKANGR